jgi:hypothetical protein
MIINLIRDTNSLCVQYSVYANLAYYTQGSILSLLKPSTKPEPVEV